MDQRYYKQAKQGFRPRLKGRILVGQAGHDDIQNDLMTYNKHLYKVFTAAPLVNNKAPFLNPYTYVNIRKIKDDNDRLEEIEQQNKELVNKINKITKSGAIVDCWNNFCIKAGRTRYSQPKKAKQIMLDNAQMLKNIQKSYSYYDGKEAKKRWKYLMNEFHHRCQLKQVLRLEKNIDKEINNSPSISYGLPVTRPAIRRKAFMDFSIKDGVRFGQIVIELYNDFAPKLVKNFLCRCDNVFEYTYEKSCVHYGEKHRFFTGGAIVLKKSKRRHSIFNKTFRHPGNDLQHTRQGLLVAVPSFEKQKFDPSLTISQRIKRKPPPPQYNSEFAITICPCDYYNNNAPIFGKVIKGFDVISKINDTLKTCGTPLFKIEISRCGSIPYTTDELNEIKYLKSIGSYESLSDEEDNEDLFFVFDDTSNA